ncbi:hypothetical protein [Brevundimonas lutea]|uniref:hypothetical protein n=1 Tax=Brevundimonas lutea TaxID=2293980 RepID=UPI0013CE91FF|nr:hypothetical protein [Brevundimonas lutea]
MREIKRRDAETWEAVRRAWEGGETAASCARRFDVGMANLWRRRAAEGWGRGRAPDPVPEPAEGWGRWARARLAAFEQERAEARRLAETLMAAMAGGPMDGVPLWDVGYVLDWRAGRLGPETAAADREWARKYPWMDAFWGEDGRLRRVSVLDRVVLTARRDDWRADMGLPEGAAVDVP